MRTVDPELWYKKVKKPRIQVTRTMKYGLKPISGLEGLIRARFKDSMREFQNNCSIRTVVRVARLDVKWQKNVYIIVLAVALCIGLSVIGYDVFLLGNAPPLLISLQPNQRAAMDVHFPAVALCSTNIFSTKALDNYIAFLRSRDNNSTYTETELRRNILNFGALLNRAPPSAPIDVMFNRFLARVHPHFNFTNFILKLSPPCTSMLRRCSWRGRLLPCDRLFATRITQLGFCCVFNSRYQPEDVYTEPKVLDMVGQDFGLTFLLQNIEETVYARRPSVGYEILLFEGSEYPLMEGSGVRVYPVERDASMFLALSTRAEIPSHTLQYYNEIWRGCRLRDSSVQKSWRSSYTWCLSECRRHTVAAMCRCAPHTLPSPPAPPTPSPADTSDTTPVPPCTPDNLACLNKHREKFMYYYPGEQSEQWSSALGEELQDAQECLHCLPDCARLVYSATIAYTHYQHNDKIFQNFVSKGLSLSNATIVRVFYTSEHQHQLYLVEGYMRWYEAVALVASEWVSVVGVTVMFLIELVFYCCIRWPYHCTRRIMERRPNTTDKS